MKRYFIGGLMLNIEYIEIYDSDLLLNIVFSSILDKNQIVNEVLSKLDTVYDKGYHKDYIRLKCFQSDYIPNSPEMAIIVTSKKYRIARYKEYYTDGAYDYITKIGGWAVYNNIIDKSGGFRIDTSFKNHYFELFAVYNALLLIDQSDDKYHFIITDSKNSMSEIKSNTKYQELPLINIKKSISNVLRSISIRKKIVKTIYVRGHDLCEENIKADHLAVKAKLNAMTDYYSREPFLAMQRPFFRNKSDFILYKDMLEAKLINNLI